MINAESKCPYANALDCPLYLAAHLGGFGCDDGEIGDGLCAVDRGLDYDRELGRFRAAYPRDLALFEWNREKRNNQAQRRRNLTANGIH